MRDEASGMEEEHLIRHTKHLIVQRAIMWLKANSLQMGLSFLTKSWRFAVCVNCNVSCEPSSRGLSTPRC